MILSKKQAGYSPKTLFSTLLCAFFIVGAVAAISGIDKHLIFATSFIPPLIVAWYQMASKQHEIFNPLSFFLLTLFFGVTSQTFYLFFLDDGVHRFALGNLTDVNSIGIAILALSIATVFLVFGYAFNTKWPEVNRRDSGVVWDINRVQIVVIACLVIGLVSLVYYASVFNIFNDITGQTAVIRRIVDEETGISRVLAWTRVGINFTQIAFFLAYAAYLDDRIQKSRLLFALVLISGFCGALLPFLASSRTGLIAYILGAVAINHFSRGGWSANKIRLVSLAMIFIIIIMGTLRYTQMRGVDFSQYRDDVPVAEMLQPLLGSDNFLSVGKTSVILEAVPEKLNYQYGRTYLLWLVAPIPRSLWPDKPIIRIGLEIGRAVMGTFASGVPPGIVGELYYNFGWAGIPFGMFLAGLFFRWYFERYGKVSYRNINVMQIYATTIVWVAFIGLSSDFAGASISVLQKLVPLLLILRYISITPTVQRRRRRTKHLKER